ncbi:MAG: glycoside hydrolase family 172 protein [Bacteroidales bacterium]
MKDKYFQLILITVLILTGCIKNTDKITIGTLLNEMTDLSRLSMADNIDYSVVQYSSYDRRSISPDRPGWFANEDGFGGEPIPGFLEVIADPDTSGNGIYLICDLTGPGVIQRLWSAAISGKIRLYIDNTDIPVYEGPAIDFFHHPLNALLKTENVSPGGDFFRQFDASYFPVPFAKRCRIEWIGKLGDPHFYHVGIRKYPLGTSVESFTKSNYQKYKDDYERINTLLGNTAFPVDTINARTVSNKLTLKSGSEAEVLKIGREGSIIQLKVKVHAPNIENALRQSVIRIKFDNVINPQVEVPVGDFFCTSPGINPFESGPISVETDSTMTIRFLMPFKGNAVIEIENRSCDDEDITLEALFRPGKWIDGKTMYFSAKWDIDYNLSTGDSDSTVTDIPFLEISGKGRIIGSSVLLYNPSVVPTSWGNWWGEGDEKIFVDSDTFPSFFGTGSEDYFNYSWSSPLIFSYPYCGQPRNDGPGNRGYVANFRWHISDDIPYNEKLRFLMELRHHDFVDDFVYARTVYYYSLPVNTLPTDDFSSKEILNISYKDWSPKAFKGSSGWMFVQAESLVSTGSNFTTVSDSICSGKLKLTWIPENSSEKLKLVINSEKEILRTRIGLTLKHSSIAGSLRFLLDGQPLRFDNSDNLVLQTAGSSFLENHFSAEMRLHKGINELDLIMPGANGKNRAEVDFVWLRNN